MAADAVFLPANVQKGAVARIVDTTVIQESDTGLEYRVPRENFPRREWQIGWNRTEVDAVETLFETNGRHTAFLFFAPRDRDNTATSQTMAAVAGSTTQFQLQITRDNGVRVASKNILHPKSGTVALTVSASPVIEGTDFTMNYSTGIATFGSAPAETPVASFQYYTAVRFDTDQLETMVDRTGSVPLQEIRTATIIEALNE